jgi:flagellar protein FlgJ
MTPLKLSLNVPNVSNLTLKVSSAAVEKRNGSQSAQATSNANDQAKLKKAGQDFEAIFLNYMLSKMRESMPKSDAMGSNHDEQVYQGMMDEELSKQMAASGGIGLADTIIRQLSGAK